jgi:23S rRNA (guanosine2251-2'-O)-methyltransferase
VRIVYGRHPVEALLDSKPKGVRRLCITREADTLPSVVRARVAGIKVDVLSKDQLEALAKSAQHQNLVAEAEEFEYAELDAVIPAEGDALVLALDSVQDPHNLGALVRSAECFGATGVVIPQDRAAMVTGAAEKASAGAVARLPIARVVNLARALEELKERNLWITGLAGEGTDVISQVDLTGPTVIVVGSEGTGLRPLIRKTCDRLAKIPTAGKTPSLNASVAGGVALYEAASQRARALAKKR